MIAPEALHETIASDGELPADAFHIHNACALRDGGPWGQGFPEPLFDGKFEVLSWRPVGTQHLTLELGLAGLRLQAIEFGGWTGTPPGERIRIAYRLMTEIGRAQRRPPVPNAQRECRTLHEKKKHTSYTL